MRPVQGLPVSMMMILKAIPYILSDCWRIPVTSCISKYGLLIFTSSLAYVYNLFPGKEGTSRHLLQAIHIFKIYEETVLYLIYISGTTETITLIASIGPHDK